MGWKNKVNAAGYKHVVPAALCEATMTTTLKLWFDSLKTTLTSLRALLLVVLYALLLVSFYFFISTREATVWQVFLTYTLLFLVPALFFVFQAAILDFARQHKFALKQVFLSALKLFLVTIPVVLIGLFVWWLMNKLQARFPPPQAPVVFAPRAPQPQPIHWPTMLITTLRFVIFGVAFPLATIHLWIEASVCDVRASFAGGAKTIFGTMGRALARAFSSEAVFVYGLGLILFVLGPYLFLFAPIHPKGTKTDFAVFILRLLLAFAFTFIGWVVTITTLTKNAGQAPEARQSIAPGVSPGRVSPSESPSPL
jgi:Ca2+/Na+ antiporter